jgi:hypothetical protein
VNARAPAGVAALAALALAASPVVASTTAGATVNLPAKLAAQIASARHGPVAVLLPTSIRADVSASRLYASGGETATGYDIRLAYSPACDDGTACFFAEFQGGTVTREPGTPVALAHGITGNFYAIRCGASCGPASVTWTDGGARYGVQYVLGARASMVALADSAIDAGPRR